MSGLLIVNAAATWFLTGLVWFVQVVHYPLFARVGAEGYPAYQAAHQARTTWVVGPAMLAELATAFLLAWSPPPRLPAAWLWAGLGLVLLIWLSTALLQVPVHERLSGGFDQAMWRRLVTSNWLRTVAWTLRAILAAWLVRESGR